MLIGAVLSAATSYGTDDPERTKHDILRKRKHHLNIHPIQSAARRAIRRTAPISLWTAALLGCSDVLGPDTEALTTAELLILALRAATPPPPSASFYVVNSRTSVLPLGHDDGFSTRYLEVRFPPGCLEFLDGQALGDSDSVLVTIRPRSGAYGFTISPEGLTLTATCGATAAMFFGKFGDFTVADGSSTYLDRAAYAAALDLWTEIRPERWRVAAGSAVAGGDAVEGAVDQPGAFVLAAPR